MDIIEILLDTVPWAFDRPVGVETRLSGGVSIFVIFLLGWDAGGGGGVRGFCFFFSCLFRSSFASFSFGRLLVSLSLVSLSFLRVSLSFEPLSELVDEDFRFPRLELLDEDEATDVQDGVLPKRRDSWSKVLMVSVREALESNCRDS